MLSEVKLKSGAVAKIGDTVHVSLFDNPHAFDMRKGRIIGFANRTPVQNAVYDYDIAENHFSGDTCAVLEMEEPHGHLPKQSSPLSEVLTLKDNHRLWLTNYIVEVLETVSETSMRFDLRRYYAAMGQPMPAFEDDSALKRAWEAIQ